jgi:CubicO group peptidase (beta-lactamase class C family)
VPSASIAVVRDGQIAYLKAYGDAKIEPKTPATAQMRYSIGLIKQFTAVAILLLQEQGKLSLDDKVGKYIPDLTRE